MEITKEYLHEVCKVGQGNDCCRYILAGVDGIICGKDDPSLKTSLDKQIQMKARGDNCEGWDSYQKSQ